MVTRASQKCFPFSSPRGCCSARTSVSFLDPHPRLCHIIKKGETANETAFKTCAIKARAAIALAFAALTAQAFITPRAIDLPFSAAPYNLAKEMSSTSVRRQRWCRSCRPATIHGRPRLRPGRGWRARSARTTHLLRGGNFGIIC